QTAFMARGFYLPMRAGDPIEGRAYVAVEPIRHDEAFRLAEALGPPTLHPASSGDLQGLAEDAVTTLRRALFNAGLTLPSLGLDSPCGHTGTVLVELGNARPDVVTRLAELVEKGAES
ncbi:hypothetical protein AB0M39_41545, partial [Streptomyces sp. NPDC051907]|uniref:hypothetical protein n=1 Tax=Streptomyces sp. NPDC051907 TaxID=3155284 RepID=UPI00344138B0